MEFYGSIGLVSGSVTASVLSGSFKGDGSGLYNVQASGVTGLNLSQIANGSNTASVSTNGFNVNTNTSITGALNVSGSITSQTTTLISGSSQVNITGTTGFSTFSSSLATTDLNQSNRLDSIEVKTGSYAITGSNTFYGTQNISGSIIPTIDNAFDLGSATYQWRDVYISSGSLYIDGTKVLGSTAQELTITTDNGQSIKILENTTDSIILQVADGDIELKSSADGDILLDPTNGKIMLKGPVEVLNGQKIQSSVGGTPVVFANDIVISGSIDLTGTIEGLNLTDFSSSLSSRLGAVESGGTSLNSFTASASSRLGSLETESGSIRTAVNSYTSSTDSRLTSIETTTGSIISTNTTQTNRLDSVELKTGSYATTGSNSFNGNQTITGSLTVTQNLTVLGSASFLIVTSSQIAVSSSTISVNIFEPAERFGGLKVYDSGSESHLATASLLWDSLNNHWIYQNASGSNYSGGMLLAGPRNTGSLGQEVGLTSGKIAKSVGGDHLDNSIITETGGGIGINGNLVITGSIFSSVTSLVSGSSQISFNGITDKPTLISGSSQVSFNTISDKPSLVSGSSQITFSGISGLPTLVSGSSQISFNSISDKPSLVSGSSQIDLTQTTNYSSGILTRLNAVGVFSGSAQVTGISNSQLTNSSFYVGTTSISLGRSSASQTLTGVSVDGNAATAGGFTPSQTSGTANRIVVADANGYIINNYFNASGGGSERNASGMGYFAGHNSSDYYYRSYTAAAAAALLSGQAMNINGTATNITAYTINQNVGSSNQPTFAGANLTDRLYLNGGSYEGSILFGSSTTWRCGIRQHDDADAELRIWTVNSNGMIFLANGYNGEPADIARPTDGLVVGPSNNVGIGNFSSSDPGYKLQVNGTGYFSGNLTTAAYVIVGGSYGSNAYNAVSSTRLFFGGGDTDAVSNYYIGTNMEDVGGNYTKLDLRWHTGIRMGAQQGYGGIRFYNNEDLGSVLFSIAYTDANVRSHTNLIPSANNSYNLGTTDLRWANIYTNDLHLSNENKEGGNEIDGTTGNWTIQEGQENLYIINNKNGKKFKINLTEII
jgi:hypothetical protein